MPVEFLGMGGINDGSETHARTGRYLDELAWEKEHAVVDRIRARTQGGQALTRRHPFGRPPNPGSQRLLAVAAEGERFDRAVGTPTAATTEGAGNSDALVGTPETVAEALLDDYDLGVTVLSARGYDTVADTRDFGRYVIPIVRGEVARRDAERLAVAPQPVAVPA